MISLSSRSISATSGNGSPWTSSLPSPSFGNVITACGSLRVASNSSSIAARNSATQTATPITATAASSDPTRSRGRIFTPSRLLTRATPTDSAPPVVRVRSPSHHPTPHHPHPAHPSRLRCILGGPGHRERNTNVGFGGQATATGSRRGRVRRSPSPGRGCLGGRPHGRLLAMMRPPESNSPPHTPHGSSRSRAPARQSACRGHRPHIALARAMSITLSEKNNALEGAVAVRAASDQPSGRFLAGRSRTVRFSRLEQRRVTGFDERGVVHGVVLFEVVVGSEVVGRVQKGHGRCLSVSCLMVEWDRNRVGKTKEAAGSEPGGLVRGDLTLVLRQNSFEEAGAESLGAGVRWSGCARSTCGRRTPNCRRTTKPGASRSSRPTAMPHGHRRTGAAKPSGWWRWA